MIMNPAAVRHVVLDGHSLTLEGLVAVARFHAQVSISEEAVRAMQASRDLAAKIDSEGRAAYGITTGFGEFQNIAVPKEMSDRLSTNLILSHCTASGDPYPEETVRGMMLLRANALAEGHSGVRPLLVEMLVDMLNKGVVPVVPEKGSLGSSGDLAPLAHMTLPMLGKGEAFYEGIRMSGAEAMEKAGIPVLHTLVAKEGLGMTNGTCVMTAVGGLALFDAIRACQLADVLASLSMEALTVQLDAFDPRIHALRGQEGQMTVAANLRRLLEDSEIIRHAQKERVQDAYALRCVPQVHGACRDALEYVYAKVKIELNAVTDNPLLFLEDESVISGGNFHGEPVALPFDFLGIAAAELADISERRIERMVNEDLSCGLTPFLTVEPGINSGFMIVQYAAASMVSENKIYAHPASVDSISSSANQEDIVSMGTTAARTARMIMENVMDVQGYELLTACQAIDIRRREGSHGQGISPLHEAIFRHVREKIAFYDMDREIAPDLREAAHMIRTGEILEIVKEYFPDYD